MQIGIWTSEQKVLKKKNLTTNRNRVFSKVKSIFNNRIFSKTSIDALDIYGTSLNV